MEIKLFKELTTEQQLVEIEKESEKYQNIIVNMNDSDDRRMVKKSAIDIETLIKFIDRKRIDINKEFKIKVDREAKLIIERLEKANRPLTKLIEDYKNERAIILQKEKEEKERIDLEYRKEKDHSEALLMNIQFDIDLKEKLEAKKIYEDKLKADAVIEAKINLEKQKKESEEKLLRQKIEAELKLESEKQKLIQEAIDKEKAQADKILKEKIEAERVKKILEEKELKRISDITHMTNIKTLAKNDLIKIGLTEDQAILVIKSICKNEISNVTINF